MSVNKVIVIGRLGADPEVRDTQHSPVANFTLAVNESWTDKNKQKQERTEWVKVVVWGNLAQACAAHLKKGSQAYVEGRLQTHSYEDKAGVKHSVTEVNAQTVQFL